MSNVTFCGITEVRRTSQYDHYFLGLFEDIPPFVTDQNLLEIMHCNYIWISESQNHQGWKKPLRSTSPTPTKLIAEWKKRWSNFFPEEQPPSLPVSSSIADVLQLSHYHFPFFYAKKTQNFLVCTFPLVRKGHGEGFAFCNRSSTRGTQLKLRFLSACL